MEPPEINIPKSLRKNIEKSVDSIISNHLASKTNPFLFSIDNIVENIFKSEELQQLTEKVSNCDEFYQIDKFSNNADTVSFDPSELDKYIQEKDFEILVENPSNSIRDQKTWAQEAKILRERLLSKNNDYFNSSYKIHVKLVSNIRTLNEGLLNIIKALKTHFLTTSKQYVNHNFRISLKIGSSKNILRITNMVLQSFERLQKYHKQQVTESIITHFLDLIILPTYGKKVDRIHIVHYLAVLDPKANWFKHLCYNLFHRNIILTYIKKNSSIIEYIVNEIFSYLYTENEVCSRIVKIEPDSEIVHSTIKYTTFCHCLYIIGKLLCYKQGQNIFPSKLKINDKPISVYSFVIIFLDAIKNFTNTPAQKQKRNVIVSVLKEVFVSNCYLLNYSIVIDKFIEPLIINETQKSALIEIALNNLHIFEISEQICNMTDGYLPLFGFHVLSKEEDLKIKNKKYGEKDEKFIPSAPLDKLIKNYGSKDKNTCIMEHILNFTTSILRSYINNSKKFNKCSNLPFTLLNHCKHILTAHSHVLHWCKAKKLITVVCDLYKCISDQTQFSEQMKCLENFLFALCSTSNSVSNLQEDKDILLLFALNYLSRADNLMWNQKYFNVFILNLSDSNYGCEAVYERSGRISVPKMENIWKITENEMIFMSGSDRLITEAIFKFLKTVFTYTLSFKLLQMILNENEDDKTLMDGDNKPMNLHDLISDALHTYGPGCNVNYTGLLVIKLLITNLDIYLYLESKFNLYEQLQGLQQQCSLTSSDFSIKDFNRLNRKSEIKILTQKENTFIIDECSLLRHDIVEQIITMGMAQCKNGSSKMSICSSASREGIYPVRKQANELNRFLKETKNSLHDNSWLVQVRRAHKMIVDDVIKEGLILEVIKQVSVIVSSKKTELTWPSVETELPDLNAEELYGVSVIIKYGIQNKLLQNGVQNEDYLIQFVKQTKQYIGQANIPFNGFDWFSAIIFLICGGSVEKSRSVILLIADLPMAPYVWPAFRASQKSTVWNKFECNLTVVLHSWNNLDIITDAAEIPIGGITKFLLNQCFLNILEWNEICQFLILSIIYSPEYLVFYFAVMFDYIKDSIIECCVSKDISIFEKILHLDGFKMKHALPTIENMARQFKHIF